MVREARAHALIAMLAMGCTPTPITQVVVVIDSDLCVPAELAAVSLELEHPPDPNLGPFEQPIDPLQDEARPLPLTVTLRLRSDPTRQVTVVAEGSDRLGVPPSLYQRARVRFTHDEAHVLCMRLDRACLHVACGASLTCSRGVCVPQDSFPLPLYPDDCHEMAIDAGSSDGGGDADGGMGHTGCPDGG